MAGLYLGTYLFGALAGLLIRVSSFLWILFAALTAGVIYTAVRHAAPVHIAEVAVISAVVAQLGYVSGVAMKAGATALSRPNSRLGGRTDTTPPDR